MPTPVDLQSAVAPGLLRRFAAMLYDSLLLSGVLLAAVTLATLPLGLLWGVELDPAHALFQLYLLAVIVLFFVYFWIRGGQTLGMRAWRLRVLRDDGAPLTLRDALLRLLYASFSWLALGAGFLWALFDQDGLTWHDRASRTRLVLLKKGGAPGD